MHAPDAMMVAGAALWIPISLRIYVGCVVYQTVLVRVVVVEVGLLDLLSALCGWPAHVVGSFPVDSIVRKLLVPALCFGRMAVLVRILFLVFCGLTTTRAQGEVSTAACSGDFDFYILLDT